MFKKTNQETNKNLQLKTKNKMKLKNRSTQAREEYTTVIGITSTSKENKMHALKLPSVLTQSSQRCSDQHPPGNN
jgi:hypothetical protein